MNQYSHFAIEEADVIRPQTEVGTDQWKLLRGLRLPDRFNDPQKEPIKRAGKTGRLAGDIGRAGRIRHTALTKVDWHRHDKAR